MTINCNGELVDLSEPKVMGILNVTPNSFYDGAQYQTHSKALERAELILHQGADFIDLGAYSSKPGAEFVTVEQELARIVPIVELLVKEFEGVKISIDTFRSQVAKACVEAGACMINDISAGELDPLMIEQVGALQVPYIMMHSKGNPQTMQGLTQYEDLVKDIRFFFSQKIAQAREAKINDIIIDPGFGFAKTLEQNYQLLDKLSLLDCFELPILVGVSRKSMIYKLLEIEAAQALNGTTVLHVLALQKGAKILRVHDVLEAVEVKKIIKQVSL